MGSTNYYRNGGYDRLAFTYPLYHRYRHPCELRYIPNGDLSFSEVQNFMATIENNRVLR